MNVNVIVLCVCFDDFIELVSGVVVLCDGKVFINVFECLVNVWLSWDFLLVWIVSGGL